MHDAHTRKLAWRYTVCVVAGKGDGWARAELCMDRDALKSSWGIVMAVLCAVQALIFCKESLLCCRDFTVHICVKRLVTFNSDFCGKWAASFRFTVAILEIVPDLVCPRLCWLKLLVKSFGYLFNLCSVLIAEKHLGTKSCGCIITCGCAFQLCGCGLPCLSARSSVQHPLSKMSYFSAFPREGTQDSLRLCFTALWSRVRCSSSSHPLGDT